MIDWLLPALIYCFTVGTLGITSKFALKTIPWQVLIAFAAVAYLVTSLVLTLDGFDPGWNVGIAWALLAGVCAFSGLVFLNISLERGPASLVVPVSAAYPLVSALLAVAVLSEALTIPRLVGMVLVIVGVIIISRSEPSVESTD